MNYIKVVNLKTLLKLKYFVSVRRLKERCKVRNKHRPFNFNKIDTFISMALSTLITLENLCSRSYLEI